MGKNKKDLKINKALYRRMFDIVIYNCYYIKIELFFNKGIKKVNEKGNFYEIKYCYGRT